MCINLPNRKSPCKNCPFRKDSLKGWLGKKRIEEILETDSFVCHKNTKLQCAGHMFLMGQENSFVKLAKDMRINTGIQGENLVFTNKDECISHHTN